MSTVSRARLCQIKDQKPHLGSHPGVIDLSIHIPYWSDNLSPGSSTSELAARKFSQEGNG